MIYGYARVSTRTQATDGNGLCAQREELVKHGAVEVYSDIYTGVSSSRPELDKLIDILQEGDIVVATRIDRIARSTVDGIAIIDKVVAKGASINIIGLGHFDDSANSRLMRDIMLAVASFERSIITERTKAGKEIAKKNNPDYREGRPKLNISDNLITDYANKVNAREITVVRAVSELGISRSTWYSLMREKAG